MGNMGQWRKILSAETVNATDAVESEAIFVGNGKYFGIMVQVVSSTTPVDLNLTYQVIASTQCDKNLVGSANAGDTERGLSWVTPDTASGAVISGIVAVGWRADTFTPMPTPWIRLVITGGATNAADTVVNVFYCQYSE